MKTLICAMVAVLCMTRLDAALINLSGTLSWKIKQPDCTFKLDGAIQNLSPAGSTSGTLKLILWATAGQFPPKGYALAQHTLGQLDGGYQINNFTKTVNVYMPKISGNYNFTVAILEYTTSGWLNRAYVTTGRKLLDNGEFVTGKEWIIPVKPVIAPPTALKVDNQLVLTVQADEDLDEISPGTRAKTYITIKKKGKAKLEIAGDDWDYLYTYNQAKRTLYQQKVPVGRVYLDPQETTGSSTLTLYFQSPTSGTYQNVEENPDGGGTTWGTFSFK